MVADGRQSWDAIVVGSGLGGLTTAAYLTTNGIRTLVLEQYDTVGGCSHVFRRKREFEFDVGVHYVGDCERDGAIPTVLRGLGLEGRIEFLELDSDGFDTLVFPDLVFRVPRGWDDYLQRLVDTFPTEEKGIRRCIWVLRRIGREYDKSGVPQGVRNMLAFAVRSPVAMAWGLRSLAALYDACGLSARVRAVISAESADYSAPPSRAPVALHAVFMHHILKTGSYYPKGGGQVFAAHLLDVVQTHDGVVRTQARVDRILVENGKVSGVRLRDGESLYAPIVVSNADVKRTYLELIGSDHLSRRAIARVRRYRMALPLFCVYLGLDIDLRLQMSNTQYWVHPGGDPEQHYQSCYRGEMPSDPFAYITSTSLKDPGNPHIAPPGCSTLEVMTVVPSEYVFWGIEDGPVAGEHYSRGEQYLKIKEEITEMLIDRACQVISGLREHIVWREAATPITQERYTLSSDGACYGLELATDQFGIRRPSPKTKISGLYLTGASIQWCHGIAGTMNGGVGTASAILGRDLHRDIRSGRVFGDPTKLTAGGEGWDPLAASRRLSKKAAERAEMVRI